MIRGRERVTRFALAVLGAHTDRFAFQRTSVFTSRRRIIMKPRIDSRRANPKVRQQLLAINAYLHGSSLGARLLHLVEIRASQINGCAR